MAELFLCYFFLKIKTSKYSRIGFIKKRKQTKAHTPHFSFKGASSGCCPLCVVFCHLVAACKNARQCVWAVCFFFFLYPPLYRTNELNFNLTICLLLWKTLASSRDLLILFFLISKHQYTLATRLTGGLNYWQLLSEMKLARIS